MASRRPSLQGEEDLPDKGEGSRPTALYNIANTGSIPADVVEFPASFAVPKMLLANDKDDNSVDKEEITDRDRPTDGDNGNQSDDQSTDGNQSIDGNQSTDGNLSANVDQSPDGDEIPDGNGSTDDNESTSGSSENSDLPLSQIRGRANPPMFVTIKSLAREAKALKGLGQYCKDPRPYNQELTALMKPLNIIDPLRGATVRYVPQWDHQINSKVPDKVDYQNPPQKLETSLVGLKVCSAQFRSPDRSHCGGLTWVFIPLYQNTSTKHPWHASFSSEYKDSCARFSMMVEIASVYQGPIDDITSRLGIGVAFAPDSEYNLKANNILDEIFYPMVNGERAEGPPLGHKAHGMMLNETIGDIGAAICALRIIERRVYPIHLQQIIDSFTSGTAKERKEHLSVAGAFRVILKTDSEYFVETMCNIDNRYRKVFLEGDQYPDTDDGRKARAAAFARDPYAETWEYRHKHKHRRNKPAQNSLAICALEAEIEKLAAFGIIVQFFLVGKGTTPNAEQLAQAAFDEKTQEMLHEQAERKAESEAQEAAEKAKTKADQKRSRAELKDQEKDRQEAERTERHRKAEEDRAREGAEQEAKAEEMKRLDAERKAEEEAAAAEEMERVNAEQKAAREKDEHIRAIAFEEGFQEGQQQGQQQKEQLEQRLSELTARNADNRAELKSLKEALEEADARAKKEADYGKLYNIERAARQAAESKAKKTAEEKKRLHTELKSREEAEVAEAEARAKKDADYTKRFDTECAARQAAVASLDKNAKETERLKADLKTREVAEAEAKAKAKEVKGLLHDALEAQKAVEARAEKHIEDIEGLKAELKVKEAAELVAQQETERTRKMLRDERRSRRGHENKRKLLEGALEAKEEVLAKAKGEAEEAKRLQAELEVLKKADAETKGEIGDLKQIIEGERNYGEALMNRYHELSDDYQSLQDQLEDKQQATVKSEEAAKTSKLSPGGIGKAEREAAEAKQEVKMLELRLDLERVARTKAEVSAKKAVVMDKMRHRKDGEMKAELEAIDGLYAPRLAELDEKEHRLEQQISREESKDGDNGVNAGMDEEPVVHRVPRYDPRIRSPSVGP